MAVALVTGATGGIGRELADILASEAFELVLVARNKAALDVLASQLEQSYGIRAHCFPADLSQAGSAEHLYQAVQAAGIHVDFLANNAGFGDQGPFLDSDWERQRAMVEVNIVALMQLSYLFGKDMQTRRSGRILNVSSVAALSAGPYMSVYFASKAFVLSFSQALGQELKGSGVTVTALCPGTTKTGFWEAAGMDPQNVFSLMQAQSPRSVAELGYRACIQGKAVALHSPASKLANIGAHLAPRRLSTWLMAQVLSKRNSSKQ